ncbi:Zn-binding Pro-Ala-Ala-Arg (PAAR) domain-containing protein, incolved in TypeVI secretion [Pseudomonas trivialis]|uniref:Zn-binding Pro-Ala-Ala-Arg (PAAR) domain-containing protein, incolved in TypeVI secretion n=1 Tax=Pseudomonas trivialis TaxID=200450 RepID=A0ABY0U4J1_9PSED|nr:Zn-binding Pro-Ala-Ala-Arg (PAAR) domain-containing protein, incolved in TypeVI secretion [Pseudomonas trivialis]
MHGIGRRRSIRLMRRNSRKRPTLPSVNPSPKFGLPLTLPCSFTSIEMRHASVFLSKRAGKHTIWIKGKTMSEGYFVGLGDKTTCGGEILDGDPRVNMHGVLHAREGDRVTCGKHVGTYQIQGGISHIQSHGKRVAGTLDSYSSCPCRARLIPSVYSATYENQSAASPMGQRVASSNASAGNGSPVAPRQSGFVPSARTAPTTFSGAHGQEPGFYIVPESMTREALEATLLPWS